MNLQGFEREVDIEEKRKKRQEEWEKVRTADQPEMAPEEPYDGRSLYERLKEQRDAKDLEFEESRKFKNMIRGLDDDDVDHLNEIDNRKLIEERKLKEEELKELNDYRAKVAELQEIKALSSEQLHIHSSKPKIKQNDHKQARSSQKNILKSVVKRRSEVLEVIDEPPLQILKVNQRSALVSAAILPGIGDYRSDDSDSDESSEVETVIDTKTDLTGRQIRKKKDHE